MVVKEGGSEEGVGNPGERVGSRWVGEDVKVSKLELDNDGEGEPVRENSAEDEDEVEILRLLKVREAVWDEDGGELDEARAEAEVDTLFVIWTLLLTVIELLSDNEKVEVAVGLKREVEVVEKE